MHGRFITFEVVDEIEEDVDLPLGSVAKEDIQFVNLLGYAISEIIIISRHVPRIHSHAAPVSAKTDGCPIPLE
ncbi:hypothetical protein [Roseomonas sp. WA12]